MDDGTLIIYNCPIMTEKCEQHFPSFVFLGCKRHLISDISLLCWMWMFIIFFLSPCFSQVFENRSILLHQEDVHIHEFCDLHIHTTLKHQFCIFSRHHSEIVANVLWCKALPCIFIINKNNMDDKYDVH